MFQGSPGFTQHTQASDTVVIPDAHLLFSGAYTRIGTDLIISDAEHKFVVGGYFKGENRPSLSSTDGATLSGHIVDALTGHVHYAQAAGAQAPADVIGHVLKLAGSASVIRNGVQVELHIGDAVYKGDVVQTGSDSSIGMTFIDGSAFGMTSNGRMVLNEMIYDPNGSSNSSLISLVQGTVTFVAGQTAKNGNMRLETPVATMGIRGTAVLVEIGADNGPTKFSVLVEPDGHTGSYNLYDKGTGQLIGTVSRAGQVTFVSSPGVGQPVTAVEQLKTLQDAQNEKAIIQQVFQLYFPNYNPNDINTKTQKFGAGSSTNNLAEVIFTTDTFGNQIAFTQIQLLFNNNPSNSAPGTGPMQTSIVFNNTKPVFTVSALDAQQASISTPDVFNLGKAVHIADPDANSAPFFDKPVPFVPGSAVIISATSTIAFLSADFLKSLVQLNQQTGEVAFDREQFSFLRAGETATFLIQVTARSGPDSGQVVIPLTVTGTNDAPTIVLGNATTVAGAVAHDSHVVAGAVATDGIITFRDVDLTETHTATFALTSTSSSSPGGNVAPLGAFTLDPVSENTGDTNNTGTVGWHFTLANNDPALLSLAAGQTITQIYTVTIRDEAGLTVTQTVTVTITGTNDAPTLTTTSGTIEEPAHRTGGFGFSTTNGTVTFTDPDTTDRPGLSAAFGSYTFTDAGGHEHNLSAWQLALLKTGFTFSPNADNTNSGSANWSYRIPNAALDFLAAGETLVLTYLVTVDDGHGGKVTQPVNITITGTNDVPTLLTTSDLVFEKPHQTGGTGLTLAAGAIFFADVDLSDRPQLSSAFGSYHYTNAFGWSSHLSSSQVADLAASLTITPGDDNANNGWATWSYSIADAKLDFLAAGETLSLTYLVTVDDEHGGVVTRPVTVTIVGTNDAPVLQDVSLSVTDTQATDTFSPLKGHLAGSDADHGETSSLTYAVVNASDHSTNGAVAGHYGTLTVDSHGNYIYVPNAAAINALGAGDTKQDTFTIVTTDIHGAHDTATFTVDITGADDPQQLNIDHQSVTEAVAFRGITPVHTFTLHDLQITDVDAGSGDDVYTLKVTSERGSLSLAGEDNGLTVASQNSGKTLTVTGTLDKLNAALDGNANGLKYTTGLLDSNVEHVKVDVTDSLGLTDSRTFVFQQNDLASGNLTGGNEKDVIFSNLGNDTMTGGGGADTFVFDGLKGADVITDFHASEQDSIVFKDAFSNYQDLLNHAHDVGNSVVIASLSAGVGALTITGVHKAQLSASDFHFV